MLSLAVIQITVKILIWGLFIKLHRIKNYIRLWNPSSTALVWIRIGWLGRMSTISRGQTYRVVHCGHQLCGTVVLEFNGCCGGDTDLAYRQYLRWCGACVDGANWLADMTETRASSHMTSCRRPSFDTQPDQLTWRTLSRLPGCYSIIASRAARVGKVSPGTTTMD